MSSNDVTTGNCLFMLSLGNCSIEQKHWHFGPDVEVKRRLLPAKPLLPRILGRSK